MDDIGCLRDDLALELLRRDPREIDAQLSLFIVAANSLRHYSSLRPFPSSIMSNKNSSGDYDIYSLRQLIDQIPVVKSLPNVIHNPEIISDDVACLLHWILLEHPTGLKLSIVDEEEEINKVLRLAGHEIVESLRPTHIFKVFTNKSARLESQYNGKLNGDIYGYHGSKLQNFYSILSNGLQQHRNEVSLFGQGIYLSTDLNVVQYFSGSSTNWNKSILGAQSNCVLLCECYDHPDVKMSSSDPSRGFIEGSEGGRVPDKYIVVRSNDLIINKYLFVYSRGNSKFQITRPNKSDGFLTWIFSHKVALLFISYALILFAIGFSKTNAVYRYLRRWVVWWYMYTIQAEKLKRYALHTYFERKGVSQDTK
ncbi:PARP16 [Lepeophtheirus salmonis]|uniref:PARP16 n=1 Tax=Lepeophtheirus salmonis TaxID=72036 RepID=A0A7R8CK16_LEPSM|nr:PARP16 [Lepeophtheirus salmonis]CAF2843191.1 PARP16 [Lepeophtheirus salmonis]